MLVDVPGVNHDRSPDVEMEGMGLNRRDEREGYGRLDDGDDDYLVSHPPTAFALKNIKLMGVGLAILK